MTPFINIERRQYTLRIQEAGPRVCFEDKRVSEWSRYVDSVWILSQRFTVHWSRLPENYKNIDLGAFSSLMNSTKGVTYLLLVEEEQRPATVYHIVQNIKRFVCWMLSQTIPIMRFSDVTPTMITKYFEQLRNRSKTRVISMRSSDAFIMRNVRGFESRNCRSRRASKSHGISTRI